MLRCRPQLIGVPALFALMCVLKPLWSAEEAWRDDGRCLRGRLTLDGEQLRFQPSEGAPLPSTDFRRIRFPQGTPAPFRTGDGRRVLLWNGEQISGRILDLDNEKLRLRTAWKARLEIPRAAVASVEALPGWRTVIYDDFRDESKAFAISGEPKRMEVEDGKGAQALILNATDQAIAYTLKQPLAAGRFGVNFREQGKAGGAHWTVELLFRQGERSRQVTATLAGRGEHYAVDAAAPREGTARNVMRTPGWHRLLVQFSKRSLRLTCDDDVLWYNLDEGAGGELRQVTIQCHRGTDGEAVRGAMAFTEFCIERAAVERPKPPTEAEQDEVRFLDDDQLFGRILHADRRAIEIEGKFGKRSLPWTILSGCSFRRPAAQPLLSPPKLGGDNGEGAAAAKVRLSFQSGLCAELDVLDGVVTALDGRRLVLRHALLGVLTFERDRVRELRPLGSATVRPP